MVSPLCINRDNRTIRYGLARYVVHSPTVTASPIGGLLVIGDHLGHFSDHKNVMDTVRRAIKLIEHPIRKKGNVLVSVYFALHVGYPFVTGTIAATAHRNAQGLGLGL
jgi:hypothetical protein